MKTRPFWGEARGGRRPAKSEASLFVIQIGTTKLLQPGSGTAHEYRDFFSDFGVLDDLEDRSEDEAATAVFGMIPSRPAPVLRRP
jgi:hypothetical protein